MEGDAGASRLTPHDPDDSLESEDVTDPEITDPDAEDSAEPANVEASADARSSSRLGRGWLVGIVGVLVLLAGGIGAGGYLALRSHQESRATERHDAAAVAAAKDCVTATQAPDTAAMAASAQKIIECGAGAWRSEAIFFSGVLIEAYQASNAHVQVSNLLAAVERHNANGSIEILVPLRLQVSNSESQDKEAGFRLRVTMVPEEGKYLISKLEQVAR